jgi:alpha/beta hydrolase family protein
MKGLFSSDADKKLLNEAIDLVGELNDKATARAKFVEKIRSLLDPSAADREDASTSFFQSEPDELMESLKLKIKSSTRQESTEGDAVTAALPAGSAQLALDDVVAAENVLSGFFNSALNLLNYTTYFEMKTRAGTIGKKGVAPFIDRLPSSIEAIHLIGHSFGGRVVTAAAANSTTPRIRSMTLLQAAFSHNGFSKKKNGFFRAVVEQKRVNGPILITHSILDRAVGVAYPLASRINQDDRLALGDRNDPFGAIGRNGAQQMEDTEVDALETLLRPATDAQSYKFKQPLIFNLNGDTLITNHGDVTNEAIVFAVLSAVAPLKS